MLAEHLHHPTVRSHVIVNGDDLARRATILDGEDIAESVRVRLVGAEEPEVLVPLLEDVADHLAQLAGRFALLSGGLGDGGGSNSATQYLFKEDLQGLVNRLGLEIRVAHYPPYCSKYNPIEHRVFPHVTRACQGVIFHTVDIAQHFIERTKTTTGLGVTVRILDKVYKTGRKYAADFKQNMKIIFDDHLPKWNYRAVPESS